MVSAADEKNIVERFLEASSDGKILRSMSKEDRVWMIKKLMGVREGSFERILGQKYGKESTLLFFLRDKVQEIEAELGRNAGKPPKEALAGYFALLEFETGLGDIEERIEAADAKGAKKLAKDLDRLIGKVEKENPDFIKRNDSRISEDYGDLMAIGSGGKFGSTRKVAEMERRKSKPPGARNR